jgi:hypothetical protein
MGTMACIESITALGVADSESNLRGRERDDDGEEGMVRRGW